MGIISLIFYSIILAISFGMLVFFHTTTSQVLFAFLLCLPVIECVVYRWGFQRLQIESQTTGSLLDEKIPVTVTMKLKNPSLIPMPEVLVSYEVTNHFYSEERIVQQIAVPVLAMTGQEVSFRVEPAYCGCYEMKVLAIQSWDHLHIWKFKKQHIDAAKANCEFVVEPKRLHSIAIDGEAYMMGMEDTEESQNKGSDFSEVHHIREYQPGDSLKDIHWKLSAKKQMLMVKEHISMSSSQVILIVELEQDQEVLDHMLDVAKTVCMDLLDDKLAYTLCYWSGQRGEFVAKAIANEGSRQQAFHEMMYEKPSPVGTNAGKEAFAYAGMLASTVVWIHPAKGDGCSQDEILYRDAKVIVAMSEVVS